MFLLLDHLESYGFRGEGLSSLCTLSQVTVTTKTKRDDLAKTYSFDSNGNVISSRISHLNVSKFYTWNYIKISVVLLKYHLFFLFLLLQLGTIITVQGLFKNLPVRKQFLTSGKRKTQELNSVANIVKSFGLIHLSLRIVLKHNKFLLFGRRMLSVLCKKVWSNLWSHVSKNLPHEINHRESNVSIEMQSTDYVSLSFHMLFHNNICRLCICYLKFWETRFKHSQMNFLFLRGLKLSAK